MEHVRGLAAKASAVSITVDNSTFDNTEMMSMELKLLVAGKQECASLKLQQLEDQSAESAYHHVVSSLATQFSISGRFVSCRQSMSSPITHILQVTALMELLDVPEEKLKSLSELEFGADGAAVNLGRTGGILVRLRRGIAPGAVGVSCSVHASSDAAKAMTTVSVRIKLALNERCWQRKQR